jgi:hypothetical protein
VKSIYTFRVFQIKLPRVWPIPEVSKQDFESLFPFENNAKPVDRTGNISLF